VHAAEHVQISRPYAVDAQVKVPGIAAGMIGGADSIDDLDLPRHGAMPALFGGIRAPSTLGSFLRSFTWGNVLQLGKVHRLVLAGLARLAPLLPGRQTLAFIDSQQKRVYGRKKQGAALGHTKIQGKSLLVRGLNARWPPRSARRWAHRPSRPPGRAVATPLRARGAASFAMVLLRQVFTLTCVSPRTAGDGHPHSTPPLFPRAQRGAAGRLGPMLRAAVASTVTLRRFRS